MSACSCNECSLVYLVHFDGNIWNPSIGHTLHRAQPRVGRDALDVLEGQDFLVRVQHMSMLQTKPGGLYIEERQGKYSSTA